MGQEIEKRFQNPKQQKLYELLTKRRQLMNQLLTKHGLTKNQQEHQGKPNQNGEQAK